MSYFCHLLPGWFSVIRYNVYSVNFCPREKMVWNGVKFRIQDPYCCWAVIVEFQISVLCLRQGEPSLFLGGYQVSFFFLWKSEGMASGSNLKWVKFISVILTWPFLLLCLSPSLWLLHRNLPLSSECSQFWDHLPLPLSSSHLNSPSPRRPAGRKGAF